MSKQQLKKHVNTKIAFYGLKENVFNLRFKNLPKETLTENEWIFRLIQNYFNCYF